MSERREEYRRGLGVESDGKEEVSGGGGGGAGGWGLTIDCVSYSTLIIKGKNPFLKSQSKVESVA